MENNIITFIITGREDQGFVKNLYYADNIMNYGNGIILHDPKYLMLILNYVVDTFKFRIIVHLGQIGAQGEHGLHYLKSLESHLDTKNVVLITREQELFKENRLYCEYKGYKVFNTDHLNTKSFVDSLNVFSKSSVKNKDYNKKAKETKEYTNTDNRDHKEPRKFTAGVMNFFNAENANPYQFIDKIDVKVNEENLNKVKEFIEYIEENLSIIGLNHVDREDVEGELNRINAQLKKDKPRFEIIDNALLTINKLLLGITANAYTPAVLNKLSQLLG